MPAMTIETLADALARGTTTARQLADDCLARIADPAGEGRLAFISVDAGAVRKAADAADQMRAAGHAPSRYAGIPIAIKDLADIQGQVTSAGSKALADAPVASQDAPVVARLRAQGFLMIGRANMTEFAYSGLGINPHYGTPTSPWDRASKRVPGGSSSGSGVAVADGMAFGALGTDTGGSCRIPAAFNGVVGYKPTARRVPTAGVVPLSTSLDSIGPLAPSVRCSQILDAVMSAGDPSVRHAFALNGARLFVPETIMLDDLDANVRRDFDAALTAIRAAGASVTTGKLASFGRIAATVKKGGLSASESHHWHKGLIARRQNMYDPRVLARIMRGTEQSATDYLELLDQRRQAIAEFEREIQGYDAILSPTVPIIAPRIEDCAAEADYGRNNMQTLRNTLVLNVLDGCSLALPMHSAGNAPTSLMISGPSMADARVLGIAQEIEAVLARTAA